LRFPTLYVPHGGGPCFFMDVPPGLPPDLWERMAAYLRSLDSAVGARPRAVLVISGHWEESRPTVNAARNPPLLFDYYGFPEHTYRLTYPAPGDPWLAGRVRQLFAAAGIASEAIEERGLDHGVFVPFKLIYPQADVPMVQLSLHHSLDAKIHLAMGKVLAPLRDEGVLIVGSGMSYHNLGEMYFDSAPYNAPAEQFDAWLTQTVESGSVAARDEGLAQWLQAPGARRCHPRPEHLLPLMVAAGAGASDAGRCTFKDRLLGKAVSAFQFG
jgi:aromatic ring-opening dioxygenase catalytic subunit (LigB family)